jgi:hypothetical protein
MKNKDNKLESQHKNLENLIPSQENQVKSHNQANKNVSPLMKRPFEKTFESDTLSVGMSGSVIDKSEFTFANKLKSLDGSNKNETSTTSKKRRPLIIGSGEQIINDNGEDFAVIKKIRKSTFHLTRVNPNKTAEDVFNYVSSRIRNPCESEDIKPDVKVEKLKSRFPESYSSFKIIVNSEFYGTLLSSEFWPNGVAVRKFYENGIKSNHTKSKQNFSERTREINQT